MRSVLAVAMLCALALSACGSPAPTPTPTPTETPESTAEAGPFGDLSELEGTVVVPIPGTLVLVSPGNTPGAPPPEPIAINTLTFIQQGGISGLTTRVELHGDGTLIYNDETSSISAEEVQNIANMLDRISFFSLQGIFASPGAAPDSYRYTLRVENESGSSRTITSQDGLTPPELYEIYDAIRRLGQT